MCGKNKALLIGCLLMIGSVLCSGCGDSALKDGEAAPPEGDTSLEEPSGLAADETPKAAQTFPIGLYMKINSEKRIRQSQIQAGFLSGQDIAVLSAFLTDEPEISGAGFGGVWSSYTDMIPEGSQLKIAYLLSYRLASGSVVEQEIWGPEDTEENREYVETYIYDDVHQSGWYSHLLVSGVKPETVVTSIKLTGGIHVADVEEIAVEVFLYKPGEKALKYGSATVEVLRK